MFGAFGLLALLLAAVGLYGVLSCAVLQQTRELGIRAALAAAAGSLLVVAGVASYLPARWASRVDPMAALRAESWVERGGLGGGFTSALVIHFPNSRRTAVPALCIVFAGRNDPMPAPSMPLTRDTAAPRFFRSFVTAWLVAGTIDVGLAVTYYPLTARVTPVRILQGIASGLLGARAFQGGDATAALGLACHYTIALIWTAFFFAIYPRLGLRSWNWLLTAVLYGAFVSAVMTFVVLPLSRVAHRPFHLRFFAIATVILVFSIGLPMSFIGKRYYAHRSGEPPGSSPGA